MLDDDDDDDDDEEEEVRSEFIRNMQIPCCAMMPHVPAAIPGGPFVYSLSLSFFP
jgi:hypothetical protein